jgi:hypothetical protein
MPPKLNACIYGSPRCSTFIILEGDDIEPPPWCVVRGSVALTSVPRLLRLKRAELAGPNAAAARRDLDAAGVWLAGTRATNATSRAALAAMVLGPRAVPRAIAGTFALETMEVRWDATRITASRAVADVVEQREILARFDQYDRLLADMQPLCV